MINSSGPIPGANFTSDTKSYPWHQPPEFTNVNKALDMLADKITDFKVANGLLTFVELGVPLYKVSQMVLMQGVAEGKWTLDFALLLAGPLTRMIELICIGFEVEYDVGIYEDPNDFETGTFFQEKKKIDAPAGDFELLKEELPDIKEAAEGAPAVQGSKDIQSEGFMAMSKPGQVEANMEKE